MSELTYIEKMGVLQGCSESNTYLVSRRQEMRDIIGQRDDSLHDTQVGESADPEPAGGPCFQVSTGLW